MLMRAIVPRECVRSWADCVGRRLGSQPRAYSCIIMAEFVGEIETCSTVHRLWFEFGYAARVIWNPTKDAWLGNSRMPAALELAMSGSDKSSRSLSHLWAMILSERYLQA